MENLFSVELILALDEIKKRGSLTAAANLLHKVPSALSYTITKYEKEIGVQLLNRKGHKAELTEAGETYLEEGKQLIISIDSMLNKTRQTAVGWERELKIAVDTIFAIEKFFPLIKKLQAQCARATKVQLLEEVFGGVWDALHTGRADIGIGASGSILPKAGLKLKQIGEIEFAFVVAPDHALAKWKEPLPQEEIEKHTAIIVADSSRTLAARSAGFYEKQNCLRVPTMKDKIAAQAAGLGVGFVPKFLIKNEIAEGKLIEKTVEKLKEKTPIYIVWNSQHKGKALKWLINELEKTKLCELILE